MKAVFILFDSLNRNYLTPYGNDWVIDPNFKRLADHTVTFDSSYAGSMPCMPTRRELHTGRYNFLHRSWGPLEPFDVSMPELLKESGIYTHIVSDHYHYWEDGGATYHERYNTWEIVRGQEGDPWKGQVKDVVIPKVEMTPMQPFSNTISPVWRQDWINREYLSTKADQPQTITFDLAVEFINKNKDEDNWFLQVETFDPHEPFFTHQEYKDKYPHEYDGDHFDWPRGKTNQSNRAIKHMQFQYASLVSMCDDSLGRILDLFDKHNLWDDTLLIVGTDHGFLLGEHGYWGKNITPWYNEHVNTPLFCWDPRSKKQGERRNALVQAIDWAPTILEYFRVTIPSEMQGHSLHNCIASDTPVRKGALFGIHGGHVNVTDGNYVYMRAPISPKNQPLNNYTLMPTHMIGFFSIEELKTTELAEPFSFTKGLKVIKTKASFPYQIFNEGHLLFDLKKDPGQTNPIYDQEVEKEMILSLVNLMKDNDSPEEQFARLGLQDYI